MCLTASLGTQWNSSTSKSTCVGRQPHEYTEGAGALHRIRSQETQTCRIGACRSIQVRRVHIRSHALRRKAFSHGYVVQPLERCFPANPMLIF